ncbi:MAG TPA: hypothetical protein PKW33_03305 [Anaerolineaceae bacterium]|nr:hypothetical protein [Anaerolineaceae bacterium]HPN50589.1 hypothetical protein [Anaerolineaceae bacterium]
MKAKNRRWILIFLLVDAVICLAVLGAAVVSNQVLPFRSSQVKPLTGLQKAYLSEAQSLRRELGGLVWPGWDQADIPIVIYNESHVFVVDSSQPPAGWIKVPKNELRGTAWMLVSDDLFDNQPYYWQPLNSLNQTPEAFTVKLGEKWAGSMPTREWMAVALGDMFRDDLPGPLQWVIPYKFMAKILMGSSDQYISLIWHEELHAFEGMMCYSRFKAGEEAMAKAGQSYPWDAAGHEAAWQGEMDALVKALRATNLEETRVEVRTFLERRTARRKEQKLDGEMKAYEILREWEEGLAKYTELEMWRQASLYPKRTINPILLQDADFQNYKHFQNRFDQEIGQISTVEEDTRLYYTGMAQAFLLDRLMPEWKQRVMNEANWTSLEDLLAEAVQ